MLTRRTPIYYSVHTKVCGTQSQQEAFRQPSLDAPAIETSLHVDIGLWATMREGPKPEMQSLKSIMMDIWHLWFQETGQRSGLKRFHSVVCGLSL